MTMTTKRGPNATTALATASDLLDEARELLGALQVRGTLRQTLAAILDKLDRAQVAIDSDVVFNKVA